MPQLAFLVSTNLPQTLLAIWLENQYHQFILLANSSLLLQIHIYKKKNKNGKGLHKVAYSNSPSANKSATAISSSNLSWRTSPSHILVWVCKWSKRIIKQIRQTEIKLIYYSNYKPQETSFTSKQLLHHFLIN